MPGDKARYAASRFGAVARFAWRRIQIPKTPTSVIGAGRSSAGERRNAVPHLQVRAIVCVGRPSAGGRRTTAAHARLHATALPLADRHVARASGLLLSAIIGAIRHLASHGRCFGPPASRRQAIGAPEFKFMVTQRLSAHIRTASPEALFVSVWPNPSLNRRSNSRLRRPSAPG